MMKHARKVTLVDYDPKKVTMGERVLEIPVSKAPAEENMRTEPYMPADIENQSKLDLTMNEVMRNKALTDSEKVALYSNMLRRYLHAKAEIVKAREEENLGFIDGLRNSLKRRARIDTAGLDMPAPYVREYSPTRIEKSRKPRVKKASKSSNRFDYRPIFPKARRNAVDSAPISETNEESDELFDESFVSSFKFAPGLKIHSPHETLDIPTSTPRNKEIKIEPEIWTTPKSRRKTRSSTAKKLQINDWTKLDQLD
jgi:hypothetical protein